MRRVMKQWGVVTALCLSVMLVPLSTGMAVEQDTWKINMKDADIRNFIEQVSDITGQSFVIDMRVKGKVTVVSQTEMNADEIIAMFESVLRIHGYASVKSGAVYKIIPTQGAKQDNLPLSTGKIKTEQMVTQVVPVRHTNAAELVPILRPMVPQYGHLAAVASANALIISDHASNIQRIIDIVRRIDSAESEEVEVIPLKYAWVADVVKLLTELTPVQTGSKKSKGGAARVRVVAEERTNRLILRGEKLARARVRKLVEELDKPVENSGATRVVYLRHADAGKMAEILRGIVTGRSMTSSTSSKKGRSSGAKSSSKGNVTIQPDETLNALVIRAAPSDMADIRDIIDQLDVRRAQVLIEAAIVEISITAGKAVGIQWGAANSDNLVGGVNFDNVGNSLNTLIQAATGNAGESAIGLANGLTLVGGTTDDEGRVEFAAVIQAINSATNANLLSTPSIMTLDNEEASIIVGQNVPFVTGSQLSGNNDNPFQTVERKDVGLTLMVTPQVSEGDTVRMKIQQETSNLTTTAQGINTTDVVTNKREIKTTVLANDGEIVVLGGLMNEDVDVSETKVPILGDIPWLGALFRSTQKTHVKRTLVVFLQPTIIRNIEASRKVSEYHYDRMRSVHLEMDDVGNLRSLSHDMYPDTAHSLMRDGLKKDIPAEQ